MLYISYIGVFNHSITICYVRHFEALAKASTEQGLVRMSTEQGLVRMSTEQGLVRMSTEQVLASVLYLSNGKLTENVIPNEGEVLV